VPVDGWNRRTQEFQEGGVVTTDDSVYTGFGFEGINETARNEFMRRTLGHLGVLPPPPPPPPPGSSTGTLPVSGTVPPQAKRASAKVKSSRRLKVDRRGRVAVRVACQGDAGAACRGVLRLTHRKASYGSRSYRIAAGRTATVRIKLTARARRALRKSRSVSATLTARTGSSSPAVFRQSVRLR
jgi:hypothetical protein